MKSKGERKRNFKRRKKRKATVRKKEQKITKRKRGKKEKCTKVQNSLISQYKSFTVPRARDRASEQTNEWAQRIARAKRTGQGNERTDEWVAQSGFLVVLDHSEMEEEKRKKNGLKKREMMDDALAKESLRSGKRKGPKIGHPLSWQPQNKVTAGGLRRYGGQRKDKVGERDIEWGGIGHPWWRQPPEFG